MEGQGESSIMEKIIVGITQGDINGVGYEVILKTFMDEEMYDFCVPVVYGSPKVATFHRKTLNNQTNFVVRNSINDIQEGSLNLINCFGEEELKVEFGTASEDSGRAAFMALNQAVNDLMEGKIDVLVTNPLTNNTIKGKESIFPGHSAFIEKRLGGDDKSLAIFVSPNQYLRVALATTNIPVGEVSKHITSELLTEKLTTLNNTLKRDFRIDGPRIAVLSLNPKGCDGQEEQNVIIPTIKDLFDNKGVRCFGPYAANEFFAADYYTHFDAVLAMYHDQGIAPFNAISMGEGLIYTAGLPVVRTAPTHGPQYSIAGKGEADEASLRQAIYAGIDAVRNRTRYDKAHANPLRRQYYEKRDDSDKLKLDQTTESETL